MLGFSNDHCDVVFFQDRILLKFKLSYSLNDAMTTDVGEVQFPDAI